MYLHVTSPQAAALELEEMRKAWGWLLGFGIAFLALGIIALGSLPFVTETVIIYYGFLLIIGGAISGVQAFRLRVGSGFLLALIFAVLDVVVGFFMLSHTGEAAIIMTLLLAVFFLVSGLVRIFAAIATKPPEWGWMALAGIVTALLGVAIMQRWPWSGYWVIGLFVGIELIMRGWTMVMIALAVRRLPVTTPAAA